MTERGISVIIVTRDRPLLLAECLKSLRAAGGTAETLVGIDGSDRASVSVLDKFSDVCRVVQLPRSCRGEARNVLAAQARGRWLCFLDDDVVLPEGYLDRLTALIEKNPGVSVFGGGQRLHPEAGCFERAVYSLLASPWGGGPFTSRFTPAEGTRLTDPEKLILCNLTIDGGFLARHRLSFEGHLSSAEENLLLGRMSAAGAKMVLSGEIDLVHRRRTGPAAFARQVFGSGRGRGQITAADTSGFSAFTLLPPAGLLFAAILVFWRPYFFAALASMYISVCAFSSVFSRAGAYGMPLVLLLYPVLHIGYAAGWLFGLLEGLGGKIIGGRPARCRCSEKT